MAQYLSRSEPSAQRQAAVPVYKTTMATLPPPRHILTSLISSLSNEPTSTDAQTPPPSNPLRNASPTTKKALLTLHALYPHALLPALDLLDRGLVTRFTIPQPPPPTTQPSHPRPLPAAREQSTKSTKNPAAAATAVYHVQSSAPQLHHHRTQHPPPHHEVHLHASWTCTCPAFIFAAFRAPADPSPAAATGHATSKFADDDDDGEVPVCKHLLACVLVEQCGGMFAGCAGEREVGVEEIAGWAAGG